MQWWHGPSESSSARTALGAIGGGVERLEELGDVTVLPRSCGDDPGSGAEIVVLVPSRELSDDVREVLESDPFTVAVSIHNV